jgi:hypothetical protein
VGFSEIALWSFLPASINVLAAAGDLLNRQAVRNALHVIRVWNDQYEPLLAARENQIGRGAFGRLRANAVGPMTEHNFNFASAVLEDSRRLIAAGKIQRWDTAKWAVTINVAIAAASIALKEQHATGRWAFFLLASLVAIVGIAFVCVHNKRLTNTRNDTIGFESYLTNHGVDVSGVKGAQAAYGFWYDKLELLLIFGALVVSVRSRALRCAVLMITSATPLGKSRQSFSSIVVSFLDLVEVALGRRGVGRRFLRGTSPTGSNLEGDRS